MVQNKKERKEAQDWQKGDKSSVNPIERVEIHNKWLKSIHKEIRDLITIKNTSSILTEEELEKERM